MAILSTPRKVVGAVRIVTDLSRLGFKLGAVPGMTALGLPETQLRVEGPPDTITSELKEHIHAHRAEILAVLAAAPRED